MGRELRIRLEEEFQDHPNVEDIRGRGLLQGLGLVANRETGKPFPRSASFADSVSKVALDNGVWIYPSGSGVFDDAVMFGPPFTVEESHLDEMVCVTRQAIDTVAQSLN